MNEPISRFAAPLRTFAQGAGAAAVATGILVEIGWAWDITVLKSVFPGLATMKANTALMFIVLGGSLFFALAAESNPVLRPIYKALAAVVAVFGAVVLAEYVLVWDAGIDNVLFADTATLAGHFPGRPSFGTALDFVLLGSALLLRGIRAARFVVSLLAVAAFLVSLLAVYGYVLAMPALYSVIFYGSMAIHTSLLFFLISLGCLLTNPQGWLVKIVFSDEIGGSLSRWLLPFAFFGPAVLVMVIQYGVKQDLYHSDFGLALLSVSIAVSSSLLILFFAYRTNMLDAIRRVKEELEKTHAELEFFAKGLAKANVRLELLSGTDPLTELSNRRVFNARLTEEFARATRYALPLSLLILDVDNFKAYNDAFGHPGGDMVLKRIARLLLQSVREVDCVARLGGEEFGIVMPETDVERAVALAERVRAAIEHAAWPKRAVTVSVGVAALTDAIHDTETMVREADAALYRAKRGGRNRVLAAGRAAPLGKGSRVPA